VTTPKLLVACAVAAACGGRGRGATPTAVPPPAPYEVARGAMIGRYAADADHVYWVDDGIHRRTHGGVTPAERLYASQAMIDALAIGRDDVFFVDDSLTLRALPRAGGGPAQLARFDEPPWGVAADVDGVWVGIADRLERWSRAAGRATGPGEATRRVTLPGVGGALAIAGGRAVVSLVDVTRPGAGDDPTIVEVDLARGAVAPVSTDAVLATTLTLAITDAAVVAATRDGIVELGRGRGASPPVLRGASYGLAADAAGWVAATYAAIVHRGRGELPRVVAQIQAAEVLADDVPLAVAGPYVYALFIDGVTGDRILRGVPRAVGPAIAWLPPGEAVTAMTAAGDVLHVGLEGADGARLVTLGADGFTEVARPRAPIMSILTDGDQVAVFTGEWLLQRVDGARLVTVSDALDTVPLAVHKGRVYWANDVEIRAMALTGRGGAITVTKAEVGAITDRIAPAIGFGADHLYFVEPDRVIRVDERRRPSVAFSYRRTDRFLVPELLAVAASGVYVSDATHVYRIAFDGASEVVYTAPAGTVAGLHVAGAGALAHLQRDAGDAIVELPRDDSGRARELWAGAGIGTVAAGADAVFVDDLDLEAIVRIPYPAQPIAIP
jgi:hypothetical protein